MGMRNPSPDGKPPANPKQAFGDKKPSLDELPLIAEIEVSLALQDGDNKYGFRNWRLNPVEARTYIKAARRHLGLWAEGEEHARDTGVNNLGAVMACCAILLDAQANDKLIDNRSKSTAAADRLHDAEHDVARLKDAQRKREADKDVAYESQRETEGAKRAQAAIALARFELQVAAEGVSPNTKARERLGGMRDLILNMVNGVFPEPLPEPDGTHPEEEPFYDAAAFESNMGSQQVDRNCWPLDSQMHANPTSEIGGAQPADDLHGMPDITGVDWNGNRDNPTVENHGEGDMVSPTVDSVYPKPAVEVRRVSDMVYPDSKHEV